MSDLQGPRSQESPSGEWRVNSGVHEIKHVDNGSMIKLAGVLVGVVSIVAAALMGYGAMQSRVERLEEDVEIMRQDIKSKANTTSIDKVDRRLESIESDVKDILKRLPKGRSR